MIDKIKISFYTDHEAYYRNHICTFIRHNAVTGEEVAFNKRYGGFYVSIIGNKVKINGSLHKAFKGNNYTDFSRGEVRLALLVFCNMFKIDIHSTDINIINIEYAVNILVKKSPMQYGELMIMYLQNKFNDTKPKTGSTKIWGRICYCTDYYIKFYDKTMVTRLTTNRNAINPIDISDLPENLLRYEIVNRRAREIPNLHCLADLSSRRVFGFLKTELISKFDKIEKIEEFDCGNLTLSEFRRYKAGTSPNYWRDLRRIHPKNCKDERKEFNSIKKKLLSTGSGGNLITELRTGIIQKIPQLRSN